MNKYILKRPWQSRHGVQTILYLGYNTYDKIDCVEDKARAKIMSEEECKSWLLILTDRKMWSMEEIEQPKEITENEEDNKEEIEEEVVEEKNDGENS